MAKRVALGFVAVVVLAPTIHLVAHWRGVAAVDVAWEAHRPASVAKLGETQPLKILPLLDRRAARPGLATEMGVSYPLRADTRTILFDTGNNANNADPALLTAKLAALGVSLDKIDAIVTSHAHFDHVDGRRWNSGALSGTTFGIRNTQPPLGDKAVFAPTAMTYPGSTPILATDPTQVGPGVANTGVIARELFGGFVEQQALPVNVANLGLVLVVGCRPQTVPRLITRTEPVFSVPLFGEIGGPHCPVPRRPPAAGGWVDAPRRLGSASGPPDPLDAADADSEPAGCLPRLASHSTQVCGAPNAGEDFALLATGLAFREMVWAA